VTTAFAVLVLVAVAACPAHMLWRMRRGESGGCLPARRRGEDVTVRQARLAERVARVREERS